MASIENGPSAKWSELLPDTFLERQQKCPIVYLPMGLCEPHGHISAFGLDTIKAEFICNAVAREVGGIVAPTQGYHIHESGYHAPWLEEVLGNANPYMASIPPFILLHLFLYQLRAFSNAGFKGVVAITGHAGGNEMDLRMVATNFMRISPMKVEVRADPELVVGRYNGDHAGKYEISQLMYIRPDLINMSKISRQYEDKLLGRFALGHDALEASPQLGEKIMNACIKKTCEIATNLDQSIDRDSEIDHINIEQTELVWKDIMAAKSKWVTNKLFDGQSGASMDSKWKIYEDLT
ncbi:creatininase family protein [Allomuricauda sp. CP2A]|jgi:creatinine amidohydrolase|uniref:creatininase family protein n=1 Tax=Allomuricauda sp. CP2A TaxID=1848189 RepID=UPI00082EAF9D|nr:creatininase family protein [Muricauda sp. CP2A]